jgi:hypothetical protein
VNPAYKTQFMVNGIPGFAGSSSGCKAWCPLPDKCKIVLLQGSFHLNDENEDIIETYVGLQTEGSKTLTVKSNSIVVWLPSICCWDSSECALARIGKCRRAPGIVIGRDPKRPRMWWDRDTKRTRRWWDRIW